MAHGLKSTETFNHLPSVGSRSLTTERGRRHSEVLKQFWADPVWRAETLAKKEGPHRKAVEEGRVTCAGSHWGLNKKQLATFRRQARFEATLTMKKLEQAGILEDTDEQSKEAIHTALTIMRMLPVPPRDRLAAARLVLDFTKAKPAQKQEITVTSAEQWLDEVTADAQKTDEGTDSSPQEAA